MCEPLQAWGTPLPTRVEPCGVLRNKTAEHATETNRAEIASGVIRRGVCSGCGRMWVRVEKRVGREVAERGNGARPVSEGGFIVCRSGVCLGQTAVFLCNLSLARERERRRGARAALVEHVADGIDQSP